MEETRVTLYLKDRTCYFFRIRIVSVEACSLLISTTEDYQILMLSNCNTLRIRNLHSVDKRHRLWLQINNDWNRCKAEVWICQTIRSKCKGVSINIYLNSAA